jgi:hypothetical protein
MKNKKTENIDLIHYLKPLVFHLPLYRTGQKSCLIAILINTWKIIIKVWTYDGFN